MKLVIQVLVIATLFLPYTYETNILGIFDMPSKSVHILGYELLAGLARRGYNVTLISATPTEKSPVNFTDLYVEGLLEFKQKHLGHVLDDGSKTKAGLTIINFTTKLVEFIMESKSVTSLLENDNKFDIIIQSYAFNEAFLGLADHFDARVIGFTPFSSIPNIVAVSGNSAPLSYVPLPFLGLSKEMTFFERVINTVATSLYILMYNLYLRPKQEKILKRHFPNAPTIDEIENDRVDLFFSNVHFSNEMPRPKTPNIVYIGGYHIKEPQQLPPEFKDFLDNASEGAIYIGFGTNIEISKLPKEIVDILLNKFSKLPYRILLKYEGVLENIPKNVKISAWYPQRAVLAHPNIKAFISHGGKTGFTESLYFGVPTLCISFLGDQNKNCEDVVDYGHGIHLPYQEMTKESFENALDELLSNNKYLQVAKHAAALAQEQEMDPLDRAVFWIEHVLKFKGAKHLKPISATMPLYRYLSLDVWAFIIAIISLVLYIIYALMKFAFKLLFSKKIKTSKKNKVKKS